MGVQIPTLSCTEACPARWLWLLIVKRRFLSLSPPMSRAFVKKMWEGLLKPDGIQALGTIVVCTVMLHSKFGPDGVLASRMEMHAAAQLKILSEANERDKKRFERGA